MKEGIHPNYEPAKIVCACGNVIETRSTRPEIHVEHLLEPATPSITGKQKLMDTAGRVERFRKKYGSHQDRAAVAAAVLARRGGTGRGDGDPRRPFFGRSTETEPCSTSSKTSSAATSSSRTSLVSTRR